MFSRILGQSSVFAGGRSLYETLRQFDDNDDDDSESPEDVEEQAGMMAGGYDDELEGPGDYELSPPADLTKGSSIKPHRIDITAPHNTASLFAVTQTPSIEDRDLEQDEVPTSLLIERTADNMDVPNRIGARHGPSTNRSAIPLSGLNPRAAGRHKLHFQAPQGRENASQYTKKTSGAFRMGSIDPKSRAMWRWANVENLDNFLHDVYQYYVGNGIYSIILTRALNLLTSAFVVAFTVFFGACIDYTHIKHSTKLSQIVISQCTARLSTTPSFLLWIFLMYWTWTLINHILDCRRLWELHQFYQYLLDIPESDMQTISWQEVVQRLMRLRDANPATSNALRTRHRASQSKQRMDAHDIANRLMRKENYLIALFNKDVLNLTVPLPFLSKRGNILTKALTWNIEICVMDFVFNSRGQLRPIFLKENQRKLLGDGLRRRFMFYGWANLIFAPLILSYLVIFFFLRYYAEFQKNPGQIGHRQYTPLAEWKFREFNELWHMFEQRINMSYPFAERYVDQFPKDKTIQLARFVHFVAGAFAAVLAIAALYDPELITTFEITPGGTIVFYAGLLASIIAIARGLIPEEKLVYDPEEALKYVINYTHYQPLEWHGKLHSDDVKQAFMKLYDLKVMIFLEELLSVMTTPFVMWFSLYKSSDKIIDFFREFTVHVDGIGYVCSYAVFDFKRHGAMKVDTRGEQGVITENKMLSSYWGFLDQYGSHTAGAKRRTPPFPVVGPPGDATMKTRGVVSVPPNQFSNIVGSTNSILLDPHHRPMHSDHRHKILSGDHIPSNIRAAGEIAPTATSADYKSSLGESFASARASGTATFEEDPADEVAAAGVLGLLNQIHRVPANGGRGGGVNI